MNKKIMLADDAAFMRMMCKDILTKGGYEIVGEACDGNEAVLLYKSLKPEAVVLNIQMPKLDGIEALKLIKEYDENANIIMLSASSHAHMVINAMISGAKYFIAKPFQAAQLTYGLKFFTSQLDPINKKIAEEILTKLENRVLSQLEIDFIMTILQSNSELGRKPIINSILTSKIKDDAIHAINRIYVEMLQKTHSEETSDLSEDMLHNIHNGYAEIIKTARPRKNPTVEQSSPPSVLSNDEVNTLLKSLVDETSQDNEISTRLDKLEKTQEEILEILRSLKK